MHIRLEILEHRGGPHLRHCHRLLEKLDSGWVYTDASEDTVLDSSLSIRHVVENYRVLNTVLSVRVLECHTVAVIFKVPKSVNVIGECERIPKIIYILYYISLATPSLPAYPQNRSFLQPPHLLADAAR